MKKLRILILTDHSGHSDQNSVYALARTMAADPRCLQLDVASRGHARNDAFFKQVARTQVQGIRVGADFGYDATGRQFEDRTTTLDLSQYDLIWLRLPHPMTDEFAAAMSEIDDSGKAVVVNRPSGMLETGNKAWLLNWAHYSAPMAKVNTPEEVRDFTLYRKAVLKPLQAHGGKGIAMVDGETVECDGEVLALDNWIDANRGALENTGYLAMQFLENVKNGDKRILVVNGKILGASLRMPSDGNWLCNVSQGGTSIAATPTAEEEEMVAAISPSLLKKGVVFYGMDTLEDDDGKRILSELNTMSIGGFPQAEAQAGRPIVQRAIDELLNYYYGK